MCISDFIIWRCELIIDDLLRYGVQHDANLNEYILCPFPSLSYFLEQFEDDICSCLVDGVYEECGGEVYDDYPYDIESDCISRIKSFYQHISDIRKPFIELYD